MKMVIQCKFSEFLNQKQRSSIFSKQDEKLSVSKKNNIRIELTIRPRTSYYSFRNPGRQFNKNRSETAIN